MSSEPASFIEITIDGVPDEHRLVDIEELANLINSSPGVDSRDSGNYGPEGAKPDLISTLAVLSAVTGAAGIVLQAIGIWKQGKSTYSISITESNRTYSVDNLSREEYLATVRRLNEYPPETNVTFRISKVKKI